MVLDNIWRHLQDGCNINVQNYIHLVIFLKNLKFQTKIQGATVLILISPHHLSVTPFKSRLTFPCEKFYARLDWNPGITESHTYS
jgi:hypothetical protein